MDVVDVFVGDVFAEIQKVSVRQLNFLVNLAKIKTHENLSPKLA